MDLWVREARLFKYGSGTGTNFSSLRGEGEKLSGGGSSSGLMSFLKIGDRAAGAIKSGGTTRRAAKMVILDVDHPDIEEFINWKVEEEKKVVALVAGSKAARKHLFDIYKGSMVGDNEGLKASIKAARRAFIPDSYIKRVIDLAEARGRPSTFDEVRHRLAVGGLRDGVGPELEQHRVGHRRLPECCRAGRKLEPGRPHQRRVIKTVSARHLWQQIVRAAWESADPGLHFNTTMNDWHTCPAGGRIRASNPCSEYMFLDDTACNLASTNLLPFFVTDLGDGRGGKFDEEAFITPTD